MEGKRVQHLTEDSKKCHSFQQATSGSAAEGLVFSAT